MNTLFFDPVSISPTMPQVDSEWRPIITVILCPEIDATPHTITLAESIRLPGLLCLDENSALRLSNLHHDLTYTNTGDYGGLLMARNVIVSRIKSARGKFSEAIKMRQDMVSYILRQSRQDKSARDALSHCRAVESELSSMRIAAEESWAEFASWIESDEASVMGLRSDAASRIIKQMSNVDVI